MLCAFLQKGREPYYKITFLLNCVKYGVTGQSVALEPGSLYWRRPTVCCRLGLDKCTNKTYSYNSLRRKHPFPVNEISECLYLQQFHWQFNVYFCRIFFTFNVISYKKCSLFLSTVTLYKMHHYPPFSRNLHFLIQRRHYELQPLNTLSWRFTVWGVTETKDAVTFSKKMKELYSLRSIFERKRTKSMPGHTIITAPCLGNASHH
jgi:hypothetical protein